MSHISKAPVKRYFFLKCLFWILILLHTKITYFFWEIWYVHTVLVLYIGSMTYELQLCCPSFLCLMLLAMSCNVLNMYCIDFLGEATLFFENFHCPCIIVLGFLYFVYRFTVFNFSLKRLFPKNNFVIGIIKYFFLCKKTHFGDRLYL